MGSLILRCLAAAVSLGLAARALPAKAAGAVELKRSAPVAPHIAALPRVVGGVSAAIAARINRALKSAEQGLGCADTGDWKRAIVVAMRGPHYLSLLARDDWYCGGAYPDTSASAMVFDLATGAPIDWRKLFPAGIIDAATGSDRSDVAPISTSSTPLWDLYTKAVAADRATRDPECRQVLVDQRGSALMLWPDAAANGVDAQPSDFRHVIKACGPPETLSPPDLRSLGASAVLLDAISEAHRRHWYAGAVK